MHDPSRSPLRHIDVARVLVSTEEHRYFFHPPSLKFFGVDAKTAMELERTPLGVLMASDGAGVLTPTGRRLGGQLRAAGLNDYESDSDRAHFRDSWAAPHPERFLVFDVTSFCNLACSYCITGAERARSTDERMMSEATAERAIEVFAHELPEAARTHITFFGGEPLLNMARIRSTVTYAEERLGTYGSEVGFGLTTNGLLLSEETIDYLALHDFSIVISIDGDESTHDRHRRRVDGSGSYKSVADAISRGTARHPEAICARATIMPENLDLAGLDSHLLHMGLRDWAFEIAHCGCAGGTRGWDENALDELEEGYGIYAQQVLSRLLSGDTRGTGDMADKLRRIHRAERTIIPCQMCRSLMAVSPAGKFFPCQRATSDPGLCLGSVETGIDREKRLETRPRPVFESTSCRDCWARYLCGGGCPAVALDAVPEERVPDPFICRFRRIAWQWALWTYAKLRENGSLPAGVLEVGE